jgi:hypothetical protein
MANQATANTVWIQVFSTEWKKRNTKRENLNLRAIALPDYNEQSDDKEEEEIVVEEKLKLITDIL